MKAQRDPEARYSAPRQALQPFPSWYDDLLCLEKLCGDSGRRVYYDREIYIFPQITCKRGTAHIIPRDQ